MKVLKGENYFAVLADGVIIRTSDPARIIRYAVDGTMREELKKAGNIGTLAIDRLHDFVSYITLILETQEVIQTEGSQMEG